MRKLTVFNQVSLDGYFTDAKNDVSWAHKNDPEWIAFTAENAKNQGGTTLLFGRITYEMMAGFWTTPEAMKSEPAVADGINSMPKVVFSRTLKNASWNNSKIVQGDLEAEVRKMKNEPGKNLVVMGSGTIVSQLAQAGLIDEYQLVVVPIVLGKGRTMFEGVDHRITLKLTRSRPFTNGNVVLYYPP